ncbi:MAG TPA: MFS transporter [Rugosimonospora sp.]|nr:MFS transporter [Rugosimonospora sp.]
MQATLERPTRTSRRIAQVPATTGFWLLVVALFTLTFAAAAPSPLYVVYQSRWGFSALTLTLIFAVYAFALLAALLTVGGISDHLGRRPVLAAGLLLDAASMLVFLSARSVAWLIGARIVQGLATGVLLGTFSAGLVDLQPRHRPQLAALLNSVVSTVGLAAGALGTGLLVQYAPAPTTLVYAVLAVGFVVMAAAIGVLPETAPRRPGAVASLRPRVAVPRVVRGHFLAAVPSLVATWALGGLYLSLGPSLAASVLHLRSHVIGGLIVAVLTGFGAAASVAVRDRHPRRVAVGGSLVLAAGVVLTLVALGTLSAVLLFAGTAVAGLGFGAAFFGAFRTLAQQAPAEQRGDLFAAVFVVSYLAFSLPAIAAGLFVPEVGLRDTAVGYGVGVLVLALSATALRLRAG